MKHRPYNNRRGFTLIEVLVATALFTFVMIISVSALLTMVDGNKKAQAIKLSINNLNFALEGMSRTMRVGTNYRCSSSGAPTPPSPPSAVIQSPRDCTNGGRLVAFEPFGGDPGTASDQYVYRHVFVGGPSGPGRLERSTDGGATFIPITAPEVDIQEFSFYVSGAPSTDSNQPRAIITMRGVAGETPRVRTEFTLQTTISQRILDLP